MKLWPTVVCLVCFALGLGMGAWRRCPAVKAPQVLTWSNTPSDEERVMVRVDGSNLDKYLVIGADACAAYPGLLFRDYRISTTADPGHTLVIDGIHCEGK